MSLAELLIELKALLANAEANHDRIAELLEQHQGLAEYEVARFFVSRHFAGAVGKRLQDVDRRTRLAALRLIPLSFARASAARLLRKVVKDADGGVASAARAAVRKLGLRDIALPDARFRPRGRAPLVPGGWNPSGWFFGLFGSDPNARRTARRGASLGIPPPLRTRGDVAKLVGLEEDELTTLMRPGVRSGAPYVEFEIPKRNGNLRKISAPRPKLRAAQRAMLEKLLSRLPPHPAAHGFVPQRSTLTNATPHVGASLLVKIDLENFFPTVHYRRVRGLFLSYGYNEEVSSTLASLTTHRAVLPDGVVAWPGVLPQGAPTSPAIANLICRRLDARLTALAQKFDATYTRYADDLSFSFKTPPQRLGRFLWWVNSVCQQEGFSENDPKRRVMRRAGRQVVTGLVVNERIAIPRADRRRFKAILHNCKKHGLESQARGRADFAQWLHGYAAYVRMVHPALGEQWLRDVRALTGR